MDVEKITLVLKQLHKISGFRVSLHNSDFSEIAAYPEEKIPFCSLLHSFSEQEYARCIECDRSACETALREKRTVIYRCRHGLVEAVSPLYHFGILTGFLMMGQVRVKGEGESDMLTSLFKMGKRDLEARSVCAYTPEVDESMIDAYVNVMTICGAYLTLTNSVTKPQEKVSQMTKIFLDENFGRHITIKDVCDYVGYSKSTVLSAFKRDFSQTVNDYLTNLRLEQAKEMLSGGGLSVCEVASRCGFSDQSYFSKVFSKKYGKAPTDFRKECAK